jgi:hypothetical protein
MTLHHSDVKHGFVLNFPTKPEIDLNQLEAKIKEIIKNDLAIVSEGEDGISVGECTIPCTGPRTHVKRTGDIKNFRLVKKFGYHPISKEFLLIGIVGPKEQAGYDQLSREIEA